MTDKKTSNESLSLSDIDWDKMWQQAKTDLSFGRKRNLSQKFWDKKSETYDQADYGEDSRIEFITKQMGLDKQTTLLDIGCGTGKVTVPLAKSTKNVTALDQSSGMLQQNKDRALSMGIDNIAYVQKKWEDVSLQVDIQPHDVVMASYSLTMSNIKESLLKMHECARKGVCLAWWAGDHSMGFDRIWHQMFNKPYISPPDYIYLVNILHREGIYANINIIRGEATHYYDNIDEAYEKWSNDLGIETSEARTTFRAYLESIIVKKNGEVFSKHPIHTAMLWWFKS